MAIYSSAEQLYEILKLLFNRIYSLGPGSSDELFKSNLIIRLRIAAPEVEVVINGRKNPPQISFDRPASLMPDLNIEMTADTLHHILTGELPLGKALKDRQLKVRGPMWKMFVLEEIFHHGQAIYPQIIPKFHTPN